LNRSSTSRLIFAGVLGLLLYGMIAATFGTLLPMLSTRFHLTPEQSGYIAFAQAIGLTIASIAAGPLLDNKGAKTTYLAGLLLVAAALLALPESHGALQITGCMFVLGLGGSTVVTASNTLISDVGEKRRASVLNFSHIFFGLGGLLTPLLVANLLHGEEMLLCYVVLVLAAIVFAVDATTRMPPPSHERSFSIAEARGLKGKPLLILLTAFVFLYVACELGFWTWLPKELMAQGIPEKTALNILSLGFALGMMSGRLAGSRILAKYSAHRVSLTCSALMLLAMLASLRNTDATAAAISVFCAGLAMGPVFPSSIAMTGDAFPRMTGTCIGLVSTAGYAGMAASSWLIGLLAGNNDKRLAEALLVLPVFAAAMVFLMILLGPMLRKQQGRLAAIAG